MSSLRKIGDNEMNYFQFKARQLLQQKREDHDWEQYCKNSFLKCSSCLAEDTAAFKQSKDIGIQTVPRILNTSAQSVNQIKSSRFPDDLKNIKDRLEQIDLTLSKLYSPSGKIEKVSKKTMNQIPNDTSRCISSDRKKELIEASLKSSLTRLQSSSKPKSKTRFSAPEKVLNSSYFLPYDLQKQRQIARKMYLASLQKPQLKSKEPKSCTSKKTDNVTQTKKISTKTVKRKPIKHKKTASKEVDTLVKSTYPSQTKDENIEKAVDGILDDLFGEAVLDLNRIKERKREKQSSSVIFQTNDLCGTKSHEAQDDSTQKLKSFFYAYRNKRDDIKKVDTQNKPNQTLNVDSSIVTNYYSKKKSMIPAKHQSKFRPVHPPKFLCTTSQIIDVGPLKRKKIEEHRKKFWKYLEESSLSRKGNVDPWSICNTAAESVLDDCIQDIAEELGELPSTLISELYNQEFINHVGL